MALQLYGDTVSAIFEQSPCQLSSESFDDGYLVTQNRLSSPIMNQTKHGIPELFPPHETHSGCGSWQTDFNNIGEATGCGAPRDSFGFLHRIKCA